MLLNKLKLHFKWNGPNSLGDIVKLPLLRKLSPKRVGQIWRTHYEQRIDMFGECLNKNQYEKLIKNGSVCRFFALPLGRDISSFITFFVGFISDDIILLTPLNNYLNVLNTFNNNSCNEPLILVKFYDELKDSHDLVLVRVNIYNPNNVTGDNKLLIYKKDALKLFKNVLLFYCDFNRFFWVEQFNQRPREFKFEHFLKNNNDLFNVY